jgi:hypothetical protein
MITHIGKKSTRAQILDILTEDFPLTAKKIYNKIKNSGHSVTYHAVYDRISEMVKEGVLIKRDLQYLIDPKWIVQINNQLNKIMIKYSPLSDDKMYKGIRDLSSASVMTFHSMKEMGEYIRNYKYAILNEQEGQKVTICWLVDHMVAAVANLGDKPIYYETTKQKNLTHYTLVRGKSPLDKAIQTFYNKFTVTRTKIGVKDKLQINVGTYNDTVLIFMIPHNLTDEIEKFFKATKSIEKMNIIKLNKLYNKKSKIHIIAIKEHAFAEYVREYIRSFF